MLDTMGQTRWPSKHPPVSDGKQAGHVCRMERYSAIENNDFQGIPTDKTQEQWEEPDTKDYLVNDTTATNYVQSQEMSVPG